MTTRWWFILQVLFVVFETTVLVAATGTARTTATVDNHDLNKKIHGEKYKSGSKRSVARSNEKVSSVTDEINNWINQIRTLKVNDEEDTTEEKIGAILDGISDNDTNVDDRSEQKRMLNEPVRGCGELIGIVTLDTVLGFADEVVDIVVTYSVSPVLVESFKNAVTNGIKYDFAAYKVCMSCSEVVADDVGSQSNFDNDGEYGFASYCGSNAYARDAVHSALVFAPINLKTGTVVPGALQGFVSAPSTRQGVGLSASESWPKDMDLVLDAVKTGELSDASFLFTFETFLAAVVAASSGAISVIPDYLGYGESYTHNRAYYTKLPYQQSIALSWLAAKKFIAETTSGCTVLEDSLVANGYAEGAYAIIVGAMALSKIDVTVHSVHAGATPIDLIKQLDYVIARFDESDCLFDEDILHYPTISSLVYGYSQDLPFLETSSTGAKMVAPEWNDPDDLTHDLVRWYSAPNPIARDQLRFYVPTDPTDLIRQDFKTLFEGVELDGLIDPGTGVANTELQSLLQSLISNSLIETLKEVPFKLVLCHSPEDEVITIDNLPAFPFVDNANVVPYEPVIGLLEPEGTHSEGLLFCALDPALLVQGSEASAIKALASTDACLSNPFPDTGPPVPAHDLTEAQFDGLRIDLVGLGDLLDRGAFETLTELFIEQYFNARTETYGIYNVESDVTVTGVIVLSSGRRRTTTTTARQLHDHHERITVVFDLTLLYLIEEEKENDVDPETLPSAPFDSDEQQDIYLTTLRDSEEETFASLIGVSRLNESQEQFSSAAVLSHVDFIVTSLLMIAISFYFI